MTTKYTNPVRVIRMEAVPKGIIGSWNPFLYSLNLEFLADEGIEEAREALLERLKMAADQKLGVVFFFARITWFANCNNF